MKLLTCFSAHTSTSDLAVVVVVLEVLEYVGMDGLMALDLLLLLTLILPVDAKLSLLFIFLSLLLIIIPAELIDESNDDDTRDLLVSSGCSFPTLQLVALVIADLTDADAAVLVVFTWSYM